MTPPPAIPPARRRRVLFVWLASSITPLLLYFLARPYVGSDTTALAISAAAPAVAIVIVAAWRRRVRILGVLTVVGLGAALAATAMTGGSSLPLKLYRPLFTGVVGLALLLSVAVRRPLLVPVIRALAGQLPAITPPRRTATAVTAMIGASVWAEVRRPGRPGSSWSPWSRCSSSPGSCSTSPGGDGPVSAHRVS